MGDVAQEAVSVVCPAAERNGVSQGVRRGLQHRR